MSLLINPEKIEEQLRDNPLHYAVDPCNWPPAERPAEQQISSSYATTDLVFRLSEEAERYRDNVLSIRSGIIASGGNVAASADELQNLIDETRGRR